MEWLVFYAVGVLLVAFIAKVFMNKSFGLWFLYGALLLVVAWVSLIVSGLTAKEGGSMPKIGSFVALLLGIGFGVAALYTSTGFQDDDIKAVKASIKTEFEKRDGIHVTDVTMLKKSNTELFGYAKINVSGIEITKNCQATMNSNGSSYIWNCN